MCRVAVFILAGILLAFARGAILPRGVLRITQGRIVGGEETTIEHYPYQISIRYFGSHRCGASLIKAHTILTAAHCVDGATTLFLRFVAGSSFRNSGGESLYVEKVIKHEKYSPNDATNDIALVKMDGYFEYTDAIQPIQLARGTDRFGTGTKAVVTGWGTESEGASVIPVQLRYTHVYVAAFGDCAEAYADFNPIVEGMLCAFYPGGGKDACQGDSGGPLVAGGRLIGVVSWGQGCARYDYPGVYADVGYYRDWIDGKLSAYP